MAGLTEFSPGHGIHKTPAILRGAVPRMGFGRKRGPASGRGGALALGRVGREGVSRYAVAIKDMDRNLVVLPHPTVEAMVLYQGI